MFFNDQKDSYPEGKEAADDIVDSVTEPDIEMSADERFDEAERRILLAMHYREAMKSGIFPAGTDAAEVVNKEVADFLRSRLEDLLGMADPKVTPQQAVPVVLPFTEEELGALTFLARSLLKKQAPPAAPTIVEKAVPPELPTIAVKQRQLPQTVPAVNKAQPPQPKVEKPAAPPPKPKPKVKTKVPKNKAGQTDYAAIPTGEPFEEDGKTFVFVEHPQGVVNPETNKVHRIKRNVTQTVRAPSVLPQPTDKASIERFMHEQAVLAQTK